MSDVLVRADLFDGAWTYVIEHPYDLSSFASVVTGPFDDLQEARAAIVRIDEIVGGNCD